MLPYVAVLPILLTPACLTYDTYMNENRWYIDENLMFKGLHSPEPLKFLLYSTS